MVDLMQAAISHAAATKVIAVQEELESRTLNIMA
jgi:hypothetical protein